MGLFSSKTTIYVSSSAYNMAGDEAIHTSPLKAIVANSVLSGSSSLGENIQTGLLYGPGTRPKRFFRWAKNNFVYNMPSATIAAVTPLDRDKAYTGLSPLLSLGPNDILRILSSVMDDGDVNYWAEHWVLSNRPEAHKGFWAAEWDVGAQEIVVYVGTDEATEEPLEAARLSAPDDLVWAASNEGRKLIYLTYQVSTQDPATRIVTPGPIQLFTYRVGSGNVVFDTLVRGTITEPEFFPVLPVRIGKVFVDQPAYDGVFPNLKKGYRRLTGRRLEKLIEQIEEGDEEPVEEQPNPTNNSFGGVLASSPSSTTSRNNLVDVDGIYIVQGVSLNTSSPVGKEYIYRFVRTLMEKQYEDGYEVLIRPVVPPREEANSTALWNRWMNVHANNLTGSPIFGSSAPLLGDGPYRPRAYYELQVRSENLAQADMRVRWQWIEESVHLGNAKRYDNNQSRPLAKVGEYWLDGRLLPEVREVARASYMTTNLLMGMLRGTTDREELNIFHQFSRDRYRRLRCLSFEHRNHVYGNTVDSIQARAALADEDESAFLVPLHMPTIKKMGAAKSAQLSMGSSYLVFNSYKAVKRRWYQRGIFKILLVVVGIVVSIVFPGAAGLGAASGVLGTNAAVGALLGVSGSAAAIVGAIANGIAGALLSTLASAVIDKVIGGKLGAILGTLISFVAMTYGSQLTNYGNLNVNWGEIVNPRNFLRLTSTLSEAYAKWLQMDTTEIYGQMESLGKENKEALSEIERLQKEILGMTNGQIDPMLLVNASEYFGESSEGFLTRTLMSGSDIAQLSFDMVENFAAISLELPRAEFSLY